MARSYLFPKWRPRVPRSSRYPGTVDRPQPAHLASTGAMDEKPADLRRAAVRPPAVRPAAVIDATLAFVIFCGLSGGGVPDQRRAGSRQRSPAPAEGPPADRLRRGQRAAGDRDGGRPRRRSDSAPPLRSTAASGSSPPRYLALLGLYSAALKHIVIIDVLTIAVGFVLRAVPGRWQSTSRSATGCSCARFCWRCSSPWRNGGMNSCCWPTARPATGRSSASTVRICSIR